MKLSLHDYEKALYEFGEEMDDKDKLSAVIKHLIKVIYNNTHDVTLLEDLVNDYERFYEDEKQLQHVWITTAQEVDEKKQKEIINNVKNVLEVEEVNPEFIVDTSIIGGIVIKTRDKLIDASLKGKLDKLKQA